MADEEGKRVFIRRKEAKRISRRSRRSMEMLLNMVTKKRRQEKSSKEKKEIRLMYLEMKEKAIANPLSDAELLMELANRAIQEYNEKECNVFKYKVLKIEKVNHTVTTYNQYWMTVKVLNLTLGTSTETFQIHAGKSILNDDDKVIYCCRPKEEVIVGSPSCDVYFGKLHRVEELELKKHIKGLEASGSNGTSMISLIIPPRY
ncbi:hypothetical protein RND71_025265 [Anisodus tanguticus]|uniref:Uncharacterized protein n=1 Tax=Anisodus tanguticus TaxID=243964 RepID=A0AAE1RPM9_9SOLA|nr:hypothetical protein RND71_025265 [Anisodus tanguticus]